MKQNFTLKVMFEVEIQEGQFKGSNDRRLVLIDEFISEFVKDPEAIKAHYTNCLNYNLCDFRLGKQVKKQMKNHNCYTYYLKVGDKCSPEVKEFIYGLYLEDHISKMDNDEKEKYRDIINNLFNVLKIIDIRFVEETESTGS
jgi:hypothetical protein